MAQLAGRPWQDGWCARRRETVDYILAHLPDFTGGEDVIWRPSRQCRQHVAGVAVIVHIGVRPFLGPDLDGDLRAVAHGRPPSDQTQIGQHSAGGSELRGGHLDLQMRDHIGGFSRDTVFAQHSFNGLGDGVWAGAIELIGQRVVIDAGMRP